MTFCSTHWTKDAQTTYFLPEENDLDLALGEVNRRLCHRMADSPLETRKDETPTEGGSSRN